MSKFCKTCNTQVDDSLAFCPTCGNKVEEVAAAAAPANSQPIVNTDALKSKAGDVAGKAKNVAGDLVEKIKSDKIVLVAVVVLAAVVLFAVGSFVVKIMQPGYGVVNSYMKGMVKFDAEKIAKLYHEDMYGEDKDLDDMVDSLEDSFEYYEDEDYKFLSYKIREAEVYSEDELDDLAEELEEDYDIDEDDVQAARDYYVRYKMDADGEENLSYRSVTVVKIDGKWYLLD
ncbi:MAG: hypothetical protein IJ475_00110 [Bacilli bacterium]|nr:hypothetical protein [Bacilli bacterium]